MWDKLISFIIYYIVFLFHTFQPSVQNEYNFVVGHTYICAAMTTAMIT